MIKRDKHESHIQGCYVAQLLVGRGEHEIVQLSIITPLNFQLLSTLSQSPPKCRPNTKETLQEDVVGRQMVTQSTTSLLPATLKPSIYVSVNQLVLNSFNIPFEPKERLGVFGRQIREKDCNLIKINAFHVYFL